MKIATKITALAAALVFTAISCAPEVELTERDWGAKTADKDAARLDINTNIDEYRPSVITTDYDNGEVEIFFPDAADVLRTGNAAIDGKLKEFMTFYTYTKGGTNAPDERGSSQDYDFVKRIPASGGEIITVKLSSDISDNLVIKIDASKYTFAGGKKLGGTNDIKPGEPYYDVYISLQGSGGGPYSAFVNPYQLGNTLNITFNVDSSSTAASTIKATVASLTIPGTAGLTDTEMDSFLQGVAGKLKLQKYGDNGWENVAGIDCSPDSVTHTITVTFSPEEFRPYRVEATGMNELPVLRYFDVNQHVEVQGSGGNTNKGYNRNVVISDVYVWQPGNRTYVTGTDDLFYGSEWATVDRDGRNAVLRVWFKALNIPRSSTNYYLGQMDPAEFRRNVKIVFREGGDQLDSGSLGTAEDLCYINIENIEYESIFSDSRDDTLKITFDPQFNVKEFDNDTVYFLLSPGFEYENDNIVFGNYSNWKYEIDGVRYFDVYSLQLNDGAPPLSAPKGLSVDEKSSTSISLSWDSVSGATSYKIYRSISSSGTYSLADTSVNSYFTDDGLFPDITYYYRVVAVDSSGDGAESSDFAKTQPVSNPGYIVGATAVTTDSTLNSVSLSWIAIVNVSKYHIYRGDSFYGAYVPISIGQSETSYTDSDLSPGTTYYYRVDSVASNGYIGNSSNIVSATTQGELDE